VVLNGHAHDYERFAPLDPDGNADPDYGIREFIVGTGGKSLNTFGTVRDNSEMRLTDDNVNVTDDGYGNGNFGVIKLTLHSGSYEWKFVQIDGTVDGMDRDPGSASCHGAPPTSTTDRPGPPSITKTDPGTNATRVATTTNVTAYFSEGMMASSINGKTFKLFKKGTSTKIAAAVGYDASTDTATLDPNQALTSGVTYKAVVTTGAMDSVGNPLPQQYTWFFTTVR
jgi:Big-like domain-containing protein